jgi:hypothetical protein
VRLVRTPVPTTQKRREGPAVLSPVPPASIPWRRASLGARRARRRAGDRRRLQERPRRNARVASGHHLAITGTRGALAVVCSSRARGRGRPARSLPRNPRQNLRPKKIRQKILPKISEKQAGASQRDSGHPRGRRPRRARAGFVSIRREPRIDRIRLRRPGPRTASKCQGKGLGYSSNSDRRRMMRSGRIGESGGRPTP